MRMPSRLRSTALRRPQACLDRYPGVALEQRMTRLLQEFLAATVPRAGRPARIDLRAPATDWFIDAFTAASQLLVGHCPQDSPHPFAAAVHEAERRWALLDRWHREIDPVVPGRHVS
ncbi:hypothetical protein [Frankia sp. R82]|uniref:hypothetical protein n=1 Tax=Frankia sp. R82 TaxID=2950553 RepID=UPI0020444996|nr:hypothetical protein [Frankia sp. R82]MCM3882431.1 hypothetical protein [Frankia sp. R82]